METIRVDILNPKAKKLLKNLMDLKLIRISKDDSERESLSSVNEPSERYRGKEVRSILESLMHENGFSSIDKPSEWQREERKDRKID